MRVEVARRRGEPPRRGGLGRPGGRRRGLRAKVIPKINEAALNTTELRTIDSRRLTVFDFTPTVDLALHFDVRGLGGVVDREETLDEAERDQVRLAREDGALKRCDFMSERLSSASAWEAGS